MFIALSELRFAKGRFALMGTVVALITLLVVLLSGLTAGLLAESISAVRSLPGSHIAFAEPAEHQDLTFTGSTLSAAQVEGWSAAPGVRSASPLGITPVQVASGERRIAATAFGVAPDGALAPRAVHGAALPERGSVLISTAMAEDDDLAVGGRVEIGGRSFTVAGIGPTASFDHAPVVWLALADWRALQTTAAARTAAGSVLVLDLGSGADTSGLAAATGTVTRTIEGSFSAVGSFSAENGSLMLMRLLLFAISALVVGAFFTVWTFQRSHDLAVLKAIGASNFYLIRDALVQALVVMLLGALAGTGVAALAGVAAAQSVPFVTSLGTTLVPLAVMVGVGMAGAALAVRQVTSVDPLQALGAAR